MKRISPEEQIMYSQTLKILGSLSPEVAYILCPKTHLFKDMCDFYDSVLPEEPKKIEVEIDGKKEGVTVQRGDIINSKIVQKVLTNSFWRETNASILNPDSLIPAITADAISEALRIKQEMVNLMNEKQIKQFVEKKFDLSLEDLELKLKEITEK